MQYEIAHCHHATRGGCFKALVQQRFLMEEKALLRPEWKGERGERGGGGSSTVPYFHTSTSSTRSRYQNYRLTKPDDYGSLRDWGRLLALGMHRCRSVLDDQSYAATSDSCGETRNTAKDVVLLADLVYQTQSQ